MSQKSTLIPPSLQVVMDDMATVITMSSYRHSLQVRCDADRLTDAQRTARVKEENTYTAIHSTTDREKAIQRARPASAQKDAHLAFIKAYENYEDLKGQTDFLSLIPLAVRQVWLGKLQRRDGRYTAASKITISTWADTDQRYLLSALWHFYDEAALGESTNFQAEFARIRMTQEFFDPDGLDVFIGKVLQLSTDHPTKWARFSEKDKISCLLNGLSPVQFRKQLLAQKDSFTTFEGALNGIEDESVPFIGWLSVEALYERKYLHGKLVSRGVPPGDKAKDDSSKKRLSDQPSAQKRPTSPPPNSGAGTKSTREVTKEPAPKCTNCGNSNTRHLSFPHCNVACRSHPELRKHFVEECDTLLAEFSPKGARKITFLSETDLEVNTTVHTTIPPRLMAYSLSPDPISSGPLSIIYDAGCTHLVSPVPLDDGHVTPTTDSLHTATGSPTPITGVSKYGSSDLYIAPELTDCLVPQAYIDNSHCSTVLLDHHLYILNPNASAELQKFVSSLASPDLLYVTSQASDNLYHLSYQALEDMKNEYCLLKGTGKYQDSFDKWKSANIARYHTIRFANLKDLVLYWHVIFRHASMEQMIAVVKHKLITGLPSQLTEEAIRKYYPSLPRNEPCLDCALGSIALTPSPAAQTEPPLLPASLITSSSPASKPSVRSKVPSPDQLRSHIHRLSADMHIISQQHQLALAELQKITDGLHSVSSTSTILPVPAYLSSSPALEALDSTLASLPPPPLLRGMCPIVVSDVDLTDIPIGAHWQGDFKAWMGDADVPILSIGGYSHTFAAIDKRSGRVFSRLTHGVSSCHRYFLDLHAFNKSKGYTMQTFSCDPAFHTKAMKKACASVSPPVQLSICIPDEHWGIGGIERWHRNVHEGVLKKSLCSPHIEKDMWNFGFEDDTDMYNMLLTSRHPTKSPYQLYDNLTVDASKSPLLPYGTIVVAQIPLKHQTLQTGRGLEMIVVGRYAAGYEGVRLWNPKTRRSVIRRSIKVMGDHPVKGLAFSSPIILEETLSDLEYDELTSPDSIAATPLADPTANIQVYTPPLKSHDLRAGQHVWLKDVGRSFSEVANNGILHIWTINAIVRSRDDAKTLYFRYYDTSQPVPTHPDAFEYTPCKELKHAAWADWSTGTKLAKLISHNVAQKIPTSYAALLQISDDRMRNGLLAALKSEIDSFWENDVIDSMPKDFDWSTIDPSEMGDLMLIFTLKYNPDGSFDKYKCRIVFRGDRWRNVNHLTTYSSSMEHDALSLMIATAASADLDLFSIDVKTAFLHAHFPAGMIQYVRAPRGLPTALFPRKFRLRRCIYGHPLANVQWDTHSTDTLLSIGFTPLVSSPSTFILQRDGDTLILGKNTDDFVMMCPRDSLIKDYVLTEIAKHYTITTRDPLENFLGLHIERDNITHTAKLTQPKHLNDMESKYPLPLGEHFPSTPMLPHTTSLSSADKELTQIPLSPQRITNLQSLLGDISWVVHRTRPDALFALNRCARYGATPTELDYKYTLRVAHYLIGTKTLGLTLGGNRGNHLVACVDSAYATHADMKSHSSWSVHLSNGGAALARTKKQTITTDSSTLAELVGAHMSVKDILWCRAFLSEIGFPQRSATTLFIDNQSTLKIIKNKCNAGKTRHVDIRYNLLRELVAAGEIRCAYLPTTKMIADMGTKALAASAFIFLRNFLLGSSCLEEFIDAISHQT